MAEKESRILELECLIARYQDSYYNGEAEISDSEFDALWDELKKLSPDSEILQRIGADSGVFIKAAHRIPMGSQEKAADPAEFLAWAAKHVYPEYLVEYKMDGASLELQYDRGILVRAVTRGDGVAGDVITSNALKMQGIIKELCMPGELIPIPYSGGVRGEVIMEHSVHKTLFADKANCRNAANGLMRRKDGAGCEHLCIICYDAWFDDGGALFQDEVEKLGWLSLCGFRTVPFEICKDAQAVIAYRSAVMEKRPVLDFDIDGLVVKERRIDHEDAFRARPDRQIAFKFSLEEAVSVVRQVEWSESGATYTPVAIFDPVELAGTTVRRASLVNPNTIRSLGLKIGSRVVVTKRGEIIPKIEAVINPSGKEAAGLVDAGYGETEVSFPEICSTCGAALADEGARLYCPNKKCGKRMLHQIEKWVSVLDIRDLGTALLRSLFGSGQIRSISDLYKLKERDLIPFFLTEESRARDKESRGAKKVLHSIDTHRTVSLSSFIAGFDIEGIGETLVEKLVSSGFKTLKSLLNATEGQIAAVPGFGETMAKVLTEGLKENRTEMEYLAASFITISGSGGGVLEGLSFCFTGELHTMKRTEAENIVKLGGGVSKSSVSKGLSYLVTNDAASGSAKNKKALELGIPIITEEQFLRLTGR